jgi:hypothetical protein
MRTLRLTRSVVTIIGSWSMLAATAQANDAAALSTCRKIDDPVRRLACYDALASAPSSTAPSSAAPSSTASPAPASTPSAATAPAKDSTFGQPKRPTEPESIDSTIVGDFDGWRPGDRIRLSNGQIWQVIDDASGVVRAGTRAVKVIRGVLGGYMMEFEGSTRTARVKRID